MSKESLGDGSLGTLSTASLRAMAVGGLIGTMSVIFCVSFASIIYTGILGQYLGPGIGLTLIGAFILAIVGALTLSYAGTICQPQDVTAILLSLAASTFSSTVASGTDTAFASIVAVIAISTMGTGLAAYIIGRLRLGYIFRFIPYPVISGFLIATGLFLISSAFGTAIRDFPTEDGVTQTMLENWPRWLPWFAMGLVITISGRMKISSLVLPVIILAACGAFYIILYATGSDIQVASDNDLLLGPFSESNFLTQLHPALIANIDWYFVLSQAPMILTVVALSLVGAMLNASGLEVALGREFDLDRDLVGIGKANLLAGLAGGMAGYHLLGETVLARRLGATGISAGMSVAIVCGLVLVFGADLISELPRGLFAAIIWFLGFDLILTALGNRNHPLSMRDMPVVLGTPAIALSAGFLPAVAFGILAACVIFVIEYARIDVIRLSTTGATLRARIERTVSEDQRLAELGRQVRIYRLSGFLFFGSVNGLVRKLRKQMNEDSGIAVMVLDLKRVVGLDISTWIAFERLAEHCAKNGCRLVLTGLSSALMLKFRHWVDQGQQKALDVRGGLDDFLESLETDFLIDAEPAGDDQTDPALRALFEEYGEPVVYEPGEAAMREGENADFLLMLTKGRMGVSFQRQDGTISTINRLRPGAIIGEVSYYAGAGRTADIVAEMPCEALRIRSATIDLMTLENPSRSAELHSAMANLLARRLIISTRSLRDSDV